MKNILYTIILSFLFSSVCLAEWTKLVELEEVVLYFDKESVEKNNGRIYIWSLADYKIKEEVLGGLSSASLIEVDCNNIPKKIRVISINTYSGNMGEGELLYSESKEREADWHYPPPNSTYSRLSRYCDYK